MRLIWKALVAAHTWIYQRTDGRFVGGDSLLLLTTIGRTTGKMRTVPVTKLNSGSDFLVAASAGGSHQHPDWFRNLQVNPNVNIQVGGLVEPRRARVAAGEERDQLFAMFTEANPRFAQYQEKTSRVIPVIVLEPVA